MKVCHLTSVHPALDIRIFVKECKTLQRAGHEVTLIVANQESQVVDSVTIKSVNAPAGNRITRMIASTRAIYDEAIRQDADVYHFHDPELIPIGLLLKKRGKKVIYDVHEDVPEQVLSKEWIPGFLRKSISSIVKSVEKFASKRFDAVITATPTINNRFVTYNKNSVIVHNFPILNELAGSVENSDVKREDLLYIGGITKLRGIEEMVEAMGIVNQTIDSTLALAGKFSPESLEDEMKSHPDWRYINHVGWLTRNEVKEQLSKSSIGLVLLRPEPRYVVSYPIKLFEYMSAGVPVIASNFPLWKGIVEGKNCGLCVDPLDPKSIADAIIWILQHPEEAKKMGENGRKAIENKYNWETESITLTNLYQKFN
ncbi:glycosyltransferase family 4 protein [Bacillus sp. JJ1521]|uniref:glycosyltransferase family 4 protein n=1 Tax=Bacillus sp. JJ1521 TaxID=3122957 RepID=UPI002FFF7EB4